MISAVLQRFNLSLLRQGDGPPGSGGSWRGSSTAAPKRMLRATVTTLRCSGCCQKGAGGPFVEGAHGRAAPDLVIDLAGRVAVLCPVGRLSQVPAEDQGHAVLRVALGPLDLARVALQEIGAGFLPDILKRRLEQGFFQLFPFCGRDLLEAGMSR